MHELWRDKLLERWAYAVTHRPWLTIIIAILLAAAGGVLAATSLTFQTERSALVAGDRPWNARYAAYKERFPRWNDLIVVVEPRGDSPDAAFLERMAGAIRALPQVESVDAGFQPIDHPRMFRIAPRDEFEESLAGIGVLRRLASASNVNAALLTLLGAQESDDSDGDGLEELLAPYLEAAAGIETGYAAPGFSADTFEPLTTQSGGLSLMFVHLKQADGSASGIEGPLAAVRETVNAYHSANDSIDAGVTGIAVVEADETEQSMIDSTRSSVLALVLIIALMLVVFRGWRVPVIAAVSLLIGIGWSFGWVAIAVGHLQVLSIVFTVVLLGLGIDFALHLIARFEIIHDQCDSFADAVAGTFRDVGPGLITGALTTSAAFIAIALTDFKGAAELGVIAAGGIILCLIAVMSTFPALLVALGDWRNWIRTRDEQVHHSPLARPLFFVSSHSWLTIVAALAAVAALGWSALGTRYNPNLLDLQPKGVESVIWEERLIEEDEESIWAGLSLIEPARARAHVLAFRQLDAVSSVGGMGLLFPDDEEERAALIATARTADASPATMRDGYEPMAALLRQVAAGMRARSEADSNLDATAQRIETALATGAVRTDDERNQAWLTLNESFLASRADYARFAGAALAPGEMTADDLPSFMRDQWVGRDGSWLLRIYPQAADESVLHPDRLGPFVAALRTVDPDVLGPPIQIHESSELIKAAYVRAALYAVPAILLILLLDFRSLRDSLLALMPVVIGFLGTFGLMNLFHVPLNFANMIVMPVILGIGVDAGVHVVHRWRAEPHGRPPGLSGGTGRGILITMSTTMIGFGCMLIAKHVGIRSLGFVMIVGLGTTLIACYTILPAILALRRRQVPVQ